MKEVNGPTFRYYFMRWIGHWLDIVDGLCGLMTLGLWCPYLSFWLVQKEVSRQLRSRITKAEGSEGRDEQEGEAEVGGKER